MNVLINFKSQRSTLWSRRYPRYLKMSPEFSSSCPVNPFYHSTHGDSKMCLGYIIFHTILQRYWVILKAMEKWSQTPPMEMFSAVSVLWFQLELIVNICVKYRVATGSSILPPLPFRWYSDGSRLCVKIPPELSPLQFQNSQDQSHHPVTSQSSLLCWGFVARAPASLLPSACSRQLGHPWQYGLCAWLLLLRGTGFTAAQSAGPQRGWIVPAAPQGAILASPPQCNMDIAPAPVSQAAVQGSELNRSCNIWLFIPRSDHELLEVLRIHVCWGPQCDPISFLENQ